MTAQPNSFAIVSVTPHAGRPLRLEGVAPVAAIPLAVDVPPALLADAEHIAFCNANGVDPTFEPVLHFHGFQDELARLRAPDEIIAPKPSLTLHLDYPLHTMAVVEARSFDPKGFSRRAVICAIYEAYDEIYHREEETFGLDMLPPTVSALMGEKAEAPDVDDDGFGLWGHDLADLSIEGLALFEQDQKLVLEPRISA